MGYQAPQCDVSPQCPSHLWLAAVSGLMLFLLTQLLRDHDVVYGSLTDSTNLDNQSTALPLQPALAQLLVDCCHSCQQLGPIDVSLSCRSSCSLARLPSCPTYACRLDALCRKRGRYHEPPWHKHGLPQSRRCLHTDSAGKFGKAFCLLCSLLPMCPQLWE